MLNECITPMGKRKFANCFLNPVTDIKYLEAEYNIIESLLIIMNNSDEYTVVKQMLSGFKDLAKINRQIMLKKVAPKFIYQLYSGMVTSKMLYNFALGNHTLTEYLKGKMGSSFKHLLVAVFGIFVFQNLLL